MIPYLYNDLLSLFASILKIIIKDEVVAKKTGAELAKLDFTDSAIYKKTTEFHVGFAAESIIKDLKKKDLFSKRDRESFYTNVKLCIINAINKLSERCPLISVILRMSVIFDPHIMKNKKEDESIAKLKTLLHHLVGLNVFPQQKADKVISQYIDLKEDLENSGIDLSKKIRLYDFYFRKLNVSKHPELASLLIVLFTLSHGQADVERGFSLNSGSLKDNIKDESVVSKRIVKDHMLSHGLQPYTINITKEMRESCLKASSRYRDHLEEVKKEKEKTAKDSAKEIITLEIEETEKNISNLKSSVDILDAKFVAAVKDAEKSDNILAAIAEANGLKRKSEEQLKDIKVHEESLKLLREKRRKLE